MCVCVCCEYVLEKEVMRGTEQERERELKKEVVEGLSQLTKAITASLLGLFLNPSLPKWEMVMAGLKITSPGGNPECSKMLSGSLALRRCWYLHLGISFAGYVHVWHRLTFLIW